MNIETMECTGYCDQLSCSVCHAELILNNIYSATNMTASKIYCDAINDMLLENDFSRMNAAYLENYAKKIKAFTASYR